jgi:hypothetical protein
MYLLAQDFSPTTWVFLFIGMVCAILSIFVTFVMVLVRAARAIDPPRPGTHPADTTGDQRATVTHLHHHRRRRHAA